MTHLTRREFLKLSGATLGGTILRPLPPRAQEARDTVRLGRVAEWSVWVRTEPNHDAPTVRHHQRDDIVS